MYWCLCARLQEQATGRTSCVMLYIWWLLPAVFSVGQSLVGYHTYGGYYHVVPAAFTYSIATWVGLFISMVLISSKLWFP